MNKHFTLILTIILLVTSFVFIFWQYQLHYEYDKKDIGALGCGMDEGPCPVCPIGTVEKRFELGGTWPDNVYCNAYLSPLFTQIGLHR